MAKLPDIDWQAVIEAMAQDLAEHGLPSPFVLLVNFFDRTPLLKLDTFRVLNERGEDSLQLLELYIGIVSTPHGAVLVATSYLRPRYELAMIPQRQFLQLLENHSVL